MTEFFFDSRVLEGIGGIFTLGAILAQSLFVSSLFFF